MRRVVNNIKNHTNWISYYLMKYFNKKSPSFTFKTRSGMAFKVPRRMFHTYKECFFDQTYIKGFPSEVLDSMKSMRTFNVVDVGANVGYFSLFMLANFKRSRLYAFEPMPVNFKLLSEYQSSISDRTFEIFNEAVGAEQGVLALNYNANGDFTTSASIFDDGLQTDKIEVKCNTLEGAIKSHNLEKIHFLKLDCEGSEYEIIYNASPDLLAKVYSMAIETHVGGNAGESTAALADHLQNKGFTVNVIADIIWAWSV